MSSAQSWRSWPTWPFTRDNHERWSGGQQWCETIVC